jgi:putative ABC transport system ATP-binding protein
VDRGERTSPRSCALAEIAACDELHLSYPSATGAVEALRGVAAAFPGGSVTAVVGPSGSGKSTLLKVLAGLVPPTSGSVLVAGRQLQRLAPRQRRAYRREVVSFVSQSPAENLLPQLSIREQLPANARSARLLADLAVDHRADALPPALSGGEQARAALAVALARVRPLLLSDEPTAELDELSGQRVAEALRQAAQTGTAIVVATHDETVIGAADVVLRIEAGRIAGDGAQPEVRRARRRASDGSLLLVGRGIGKRFGEVHAVASADLQLPAGAFGAIVGRSGSGKSTLLSILAGWQSPDRGLITVAPDDADPSNLPWHRLAYLPQRFGLMPELSVRENVELSARLLPTADPVWIEMLLRDLGLTDLAGRLPAETSIGQQQRTAVARALALKPALLLADEPTAHQDAAWRERTLDILDTAAAEGTAVLVATHEQPIAARATQVWQMTDGHLVPSNLPEEDL